MKLGKPEPFCMNYEHHRRIRHIHPDLYHCCACKYINLAFLECCHNAFLLMGFHLTVNKTDP